MTQRGEDVTRILCLDDDLDTLNLLDRILKRAGYEVLTTTSNNEALDIMHHQPIDLLTQDYMRPDLSVRLKTLNEPIV